MYVHTIIAPVSSEARTGDAQNSSASTPRLHPPILDSLPILRREREVFPSTFSTLNNINQRNNNSRSNSNSNKKKENKSNKSDKKEENEGENKDNKTSEITESNIQNNIRQNPLLNLGERYENHSRDSFMNILNLFNENISNPFMQNYEIRSNVDRNNINTHSIEPRENLEKKNSKDENLLGKKRKNDGNNKEESLLEKADDNSEENENDHHENIEMNLNEDFNFPNLLDEVDMIIEEYTEHEEESVDSLESERDQIIDTNKNNDN